MTARKENILKSSVCVPGLCWQLVWRKPTLHHEEKKILNRKFYILVCHFKQVDRQGGGGGETWGPAEGI